MNYWERWIGAWKKKTAHLSAEQKGIYGELLDYVYANERPLPVEFDDIFRIAGASTNAEKASTQRVIKEFFKQTDAGWIQERAWEEIERRQVYVRGQSDRAKRRWNKPDAPQPMVSTPAEHNGHDKPVVGIPMVDGTDFAITESMCQEFDRLYPRLDIKQTLNEIRGWNLANPTRRKTKSGVLRHVNAWMSKEQNKGT